MSWSRYKNLYKVTADLQNGNKATVLVFSHTPDNALKKAKNYYLRVMQTEIKTLVSVECIYKNIIY